MNPRLRRAAQRIVRRLYPLRANGMGSYEFFDVCERMLSRLAKRYPGLL